LPVAEARLDQRAGGVRRARPGAGEQYTEAAVDPRISVRHMTATGLAARRHEADRVAPADRVEHRNIVDRYDAERGLDPAMLEELGDQIADGKRFGHGISPV